MARKLANVGTVFLAAVIVALLLVLVLPGSREFRPVRQKLPDGRILSVEALTFGTNHVFSNVSPWRQRLQRLWPASLPRLFPGGVGVTASTTSETERLVAWITLFDPATGKYNQSEWRRFVVLDDDGCEFVTSGWGGNSSGIYSVYSVQLPAFPRRANMFKFRVMGTNDQPVALLELPNPAQKTYPVWQADTLPCTKSNGSLTVTLDRCAWKRMGYGASGRLWLDTTLSLRENGEPTKDWQTMERTFRDATGNSGLNYLCPREPAWKLETKFIRKATASFPPDQIWAVTNLTVPTPGTVKMIGLTGQVHGVNFQLVAWAGRGQFVFSNGVPVVARDGPDLVGESRNASASNRGGAVVRTEEITSSEPFFLFTSSRLPNHQNLTLRLHDRQGRFLKSTSKGFMNNQRMHSFELPEEVKTVDLEFIVQEVRTFEFSLAPPKPEQVNR